MRNLTEFWRHLTGDEDALDGGATVAPAGRDGEVVARRGGPADMAAIQAVRRRVFHDEQGFIGDYASDADDATSLQGLASIPLPAPATLPPDLPAELMVDGRLVISVGRLTFGRGPGAEAQVTWVATLPEYRGAGAGAAVMRLLLRAADEAGAPTVKLSAQGHAIPFYRRLGFIAIGAPYEIRGMPHQLMSRWRGPSAGGTDA